MDSTDFLDYLKKILHEYHRMDAQDEQSKNERKQYLNGLMHGARLLGVSYEELESVTDGELREYLDFLAATDREALLAVPAYIRLKLHI
ncbi:hypothetical protein ACSTDZ_20390 [Vibrio vulnificus]|uniref:Uncharacterized protein n=2 Tax=Vibrio TaxID=662 RepID=A0AAJ4ICS4_9VIBR|nr:MULTISPECIES: hypothetical protein [Vibrio]KJR39635.1 hypothetical protein UF06_01780 [Vibrio sp. S234-5]KYN80091.1 hypothetical protein ATY35_07550 [Vibrio cidicii]MBE3655750.1 hypothetical protein [Vibrio navarrensis]MBE3659336.1 hypothetical protein [Vibrio navarrensis]MBE4604904.1 hypothetical protein [Vibrio navarrensis]